MTRRNDLPISEAELSTLTRDLDEAHHATLPQMHQAVAEWAERNAEITVPRRSGPSRRTFLLSGGAALGGLVLAACSSSKTSSSNAGAGATPTTGAAGFGGLTGDLAVAGLAASLENLAVGTYQAGINAATAGKLGSVPPAVVTFAQTAQAQHKDHASAWNAILTSAGKPAVSGVDMTVKTGVVDPAFAQVKDVPGLAKLALELENVAAATYLNGIGVITNPGAIKTAASIQPVEMQHAAILNFVLGQYPVPDTFAKTDGARGPSDQIG
jgi:hypothetical protein